MENSYLVSGGKKLVGEINLSGAKNVALKTIIASLLFDDEVILENIPRINDVDELLNLLRLLGAKAEFLGKNSVAVNGSTINTATVDFLHGSKIRVSFMLFAPLLYKFGHCSIPNPGGCRIGARPIDRIIEGMKSLGISVDYDPKTGYYQAKMTKRPSGYYRFNKSSHTGTEFLILLSLFGRDRVVIDNASSEPEIDNLIEFLNESGALIKKDNQKVIIDGVKKLHFKQPFKIISDRNEAVTYATLVIATQGKVNIKNLQSYLIDTFLSKLKDVGGTFEVKNNNQIEFFYQNRLRATAVTTSPHPGFMTDWQPNWAILMTQAQGKSTIHERVFENRFSYVEELRKLGAQIDYIDKPITDPKNLYFFNFDFHKEYRQMISIKGPQKLHGGVLNIADLRAGATIVSAALVADGESIINGASILERGYENFIGKINSLGGQIKKV